MRFKALWSLLAAFTIFACDDNTVGLGETVIPETDGVTISTGEYDVTTKSILSGPTLSRTSISYLGKYTDPETNTAITADFMTQFNCLSGFDLPTKLVDTTSTKTEVRIYFTGYVGDSLSSNEIAIYPLERVLDNDGDYYTNYAPEDYYDATKAPLATKVYTVRDNLLTDAELASSNYNPAVAVQLPTSIGTNILKEFYKSPEKFANSKSFIENICKGYYIKHRHGDGTVLTIDAVQLNVYFKYYEKSSTGLLDSIASGIVSFGATEEVIQATRFSNNNLEKLIDDKSCTYIKSPAGVFTEVTLPIDEISSNDTINSAKISFTRYNNTVSSTDVGIPQTLLMIRKDNLDKFFKNESLNDSVSSFLATYNSTYNNYTFSNIARLITSLKNEKKAGVAQQGEAWVAQNPDWNKVVLVPVKIVEDNSGNTVAIQNDFSISSSRLVGGEDDKIKLKVIYSRFAGKK